VADAAGSVDVLKGVAARLTEVVQSINAIQSAGAERDHRGLARRQTGRGFAVVAHEVKALATQTANFTAEIEAQVGQVQSVADRVGVSITEIGTVIAEVNDITGKVAGASDAQSQATAGTPAISTRPLQWSARPPPRSRHWRRSPALPNSSRPRP
jgi:hypothetical protein